MTLDPAGYFVIDPDMRRHCLTVEHYTNAGALDSVIAGNAPGAVYTTVIERYLLTRFNHAAYLGRELARAEQGILTDAAYIQDAAPGQDLSLPGIPCGYGPACGEGG